MIYIIWTFLSDYAYPQNAMHPPHITIWNYSLIMNVSLITLGACTVGHKVTVVILSVYLSVTTKSAAYLVYTLKMRCQRILYGVFYVFTMWLSLKTLHTRVLVSSAGHGHLPRSLVNF